MESIMQPWPWWISGILIGLTVPLLYVLAGKAFGISTSLQQIGAMCTPNSKFEYLSKHDRHGNLWTLVFVIGIAIGGFVANRFLSAEPVQLLPGLVQEPIRRNETAVRRFSNRLRHALRRRMHIGAFHHWNRKSQLAQFVGNRLLLCGRPRRHLGAGKLTVLKHRRQPWLKRHIHRATRNKPRMSPFAYASVLLIGHVPGYSVHQIRGRFLGTDSQHVPLQGSAHVSDYRPCHRRRDAVDACSSRDWTSSPLMASRSNTNPSRTTPVSSLVECCSVPDGRSPVRALDQSTHRSAPVHGWPCSRSSVRCSVCLATQR